VTRADRSAATVRSAYRMVRSMAGSRANVNDFLLGRDNGEGQPNRMLASNAHQLPDGHRVVATPILGGLHHEYRLESAA